MRRLRVRVMTWCVCLGLLLAAVLVVCLRAYLSNPRSVSAPVEQSGAAHVFDFSEGTNGDRHAGGRIRSVTLSPDGRSLAVALVEDKLSHLVLCDLTANRDRLDIPMSSCEELVVAFSRDGRFVWAGSRQPNDDSQAVYVLSGWECASGSHVSTVRFGEQTKRRPRTLLDLQPVGDDALLLARFAPNGSEVNYRQIGHLNFIVNPSTGELVSGLPRARELTGQPVVPSERWCGVPNNPNRLICREGNEVFAYQVDTRRHTRIRTLETDDKPLTPLDTWAISPDEQTFSAVRSLRGTSEGFTTGSLFYKWDFARPISPHFARRDEHVVLLAYTGDGRTLISASEEGVIRVWDVASGTEVHTIPPPMRAKELSERSSEVGRYPLPTLTHVCVSADHSTLAAAYADGIVRVWKLSDIVPQSPHP